jgi:hypothetical protein
MQKNKPSSINFLELLKISRIPYQNLFGAKKQKHKERNLEEKSKEN